MTPEPNEFCTESAPWPPPRNWSPKKRRKNGSLTRGDTVLRTVRLVKMFTTAGAVRFTSGAKVNRISVCEAGTVGAGLGPGRPGREHRHRRSDCRYVGCKAHLDPMPEHRRILAPLQR